MTGDSQSAQLAQTAKQLSSRMLLERGYRETVKQNIGAHDCGKDLGGLGGVVGGGGLGRPKENLWTKGIFTRSSLWRR